MQKLYQDSNAIVRRFGKPSLFITFTANLLGVTYTVTYGNRLDLLITLVRSRSDVCLGRLV